MIEIERKFLVLNQDYKKEAYANNEIVQGYINTNPERTVRIRIKGDKGFITIKGVGSETGMSRFEWEKEIDINEARQLLKLCLKGVISKVRYEVKVGHHIFEVDEFLEDNYGLLIAEIELKSENEIFEKPNWLGEEVTNDDKYYNAYISQRPYSEW